MFNKSSLVGMKSPMSLQRIGKRMYHNKKGFSLIELMIAVVVISLVSLGIFQAFSVAFQTLNDAKDRTVATNYAQQILEDYKDSHFKEIKSFSNYIEGTKFIQNVYVQTVDDNDNLKKVIVTISWKDRKNNPKNINVSTLIYDTQTAAEIGSTPAGIIIYANPYNLLPGTDERAVPSEIFAEIIDEKGDLITDWDDSNVNFSIESVVNLENESKDPSYLGSLSITNDMPVQGIAETSFNQYTGEEREGYVEIKASMNVEGVGEIYDTLVLLVTNEAVAIVLTSDKEIIRTEGGNEGTANITATIVDAGNDLVATEREIDINLISGPGNLANLIPVNNGVAYVDLISGDAAGISTIIATTILLEPGSVEIEIVDPGDNNISVETNDQKIVQQGSAEITAYLTDYLKNPISGETINFSTDNGTLSSNSMPTGVDGSAMVTLTMNNAGSAMVTASWTKEDSSVITDTVEVLCENHNLYVSAEPVTIIEGSSTTIKAELTNYDGDNVAFELINFEILEGNGSLSINSDTTDESGVASVMLSINSQGITIVGVSWSGDPTVVAGNVEVECISAPTYTVELTGNTTISVGDTPIITATVMEDGNPVGSGIEVSFLLNNYDNARLDGLSTSVNKLTDENGLAYVVLSGLTAGEQVTVTAELENENASDNISITCETLSISIDLAFPANIKHGTGRWGKEELYFDIIITGGSINLDKMVVLWESDNGEELRRVYIEDIEVYKNNQGAASGTTISFNRGLQYYTLEDGNEYTIKMLFDENILDKDWSVTFLDPDTEEEISTIIFYLN